MANSTLKVQTGARNSGNARWMDAIENGEIAHAFVPELVWESRVTHFDLRGEHATLVTEFDLTEAALVNGRLRLAFPGLGDDGDPLNLDFVREAGEDEAACVTAIIALVAGAAELDVVVVATAGDDPEVLRLTYTTGIAPIAATLTLDPSTTWDITFGGTPADGDYETEFSTGPITITTPRSTTPSTNADLATQHAIDIEAETDLDTLVNDATAASAVVTVTFVYGEGAGETLTCSPSGGAAAMDAEASTPNVVEYTPDHATTVNLNDLHPGNELPAPVQRLDGTTAYVAAAFFAATSFMVGDEDGADTLLTSSDASTTGLKYTVGATKAAVSAPDTTEPTVTVHSPVLTTFSAGTIVVLIPFVGIPEA
jgi:hypothetical protein